MRNVTLFAILLLAGCERRNSTTPPGAPVDARAVLDRLDTHMDYIKQVYEKSAEAVEDNKEGLGNLNNRLFVVEDDIVKHEEDLVQVKADFVEMSAEMKRVIPSPTPFPAAASHPDDYVYGSASPAAMREISKKLGELLEMIKANEEAAIERAKVFTKQLAKNLTDIAELQAVAERNSNPEIMKLQDIAIKYRDAAVQLQTEVDYLLKRVAKLAAQVNSQRGQPRTEPRRRAPAPKAVPRDKVEKDPLVRRKLSPAIILVSQSKPAASPGSTQASVPVSTPEPVARPSRRTTRPANWPVRIEDRPVRPKIKLTVKEYVARNRREHLAYVTGNVLMEEKWKIIRGKDVKFEP